MAWYETTVDLVVGLAWPAAIVVLSIVFKQNLSSLLTGLGERLGQLREARLPGGLSLAFDEQVLEEEATELAEHLSQTTTASPEEVKRIARSYLQERQVRNYLLRVVGARGSVREQGLLRDAAERLGRLGDVDIDSELDELVKDGLVDRINDRIQLTARGYERYLSIG